MPEPVRNEIMRINCHIGREILNWGLYTKIFIKHPEPLFCDGVKFWFEPTKVSKGVRWLKLKYKIMNSIDFEPITLMEGEEGYAYIEDRHIPLMMQRYGFIANLVKDKKKAEVAVYNVILMKMWFAKHKPDYKVCGIDISNACGAVILKVNTADRITHPGMFAEFCISWMKEHAGHIEKTMKMEGVDYEAEIVAKLAETIKKIL